MTRIFVAGYQHETNTFAPSPADWAAFNRGDAFPAFCRGQAMLDVFRGTNMPTGGFVDEAAARGWTLLPSAWAGATPSAHVTEDAFERIAAAITTDLREALAQPQGLDGIYLDLHGAAVATHVDDSEGELLARLRRMVGTKLPIVASLDLHANVTARMLDQADALVAYRSYPHVDMAQTGARAAVLLATHLQRGHRPALASRALPFLIPLNSQATGMAPAQGHYALLADLDRRHGSTTSFCMGFPASDFAECAPRVWAHADTPEDAQRTVDALYAAVAEPAPWALRMLDARSAVAQALALADVASSVTGPVVVADTQDNAGAGADSNTTGLLRALLAQGAGQRHPQRVVVGMVFDEALAARAHAVGVGGVVESTLGRAVPTFTGELSDPPLAGRFTVRALSNGQCTLNGPMMTGMAVNFGPSACVDVDGILVAVVSGKAQLLDREMLRMVGVVPEAMRIIVVKSSNHFRADFAPIAQRVLVARAAGPMAADPADLPWRHLPEAMRQRPK